MFNTSKRILFGKRDPERQIRLEQFRYKTNDEIIVRHKEDLYTKLQNANKNRQPAHMLETDQIQSLNSNIRLYSREHSHRIVMSLHLKMKEILNYTV